MAAVIPRIGNIDAAEAREREARFEVALVRLLEAVKLARLEREAPDDAHARRGCPAPSRSGARARPGWRACAGRAASRSSRVVMTRSGSITNAASVSLPRDAHHDLQRAREGEDDVHDVEDAEAEEHPHLGEVARRAAHDLARGHLPVERRPEAVQPVEEDGAELVLDVAPGVEDEPAARHAGHERDEREDEDEPARARARSSGRRRRCGRRPSWTASRSGSSPAGTPRGPRRRRDSAGRCRLNCGPERRRQLGRDLTVRAHVRSALPSACGATRRARGAPSLRPPP